MLTYSKVRGRRWVVAGGAAVAAAVCGVATAMAAGVVPLDPFGSNQVGHQQADDRVLLPDNQWISPYGSRAATFSAETIGTAISPDGTKVVAQTGADNIGKPQLTILDAATGSVLQTFGGTGVAAPVYSPDGTALYAATLTSILKYSVGADGLVTDPTAPTTISLGGGAFPYSMAISADGKTLYAAESGINKLAIIDTATGSVTGQVAVGNAPAGVAVVGKEVWVSNRGGRPAVAGDTTNKSDGTAVVSDPSTGASTTGTISVVDPRKVQVTAPTAPDTSATAPDVINIDFADGTPAEHAQNLPATTYGAPTIAQDDGLGANVATFNGTTDAYTYPFQDQWSKVANSFTVECKFRWNGAAPSTADKGVCEDLNGGGIGVDVLNGEPMTYAHIGGGYKEIFDPTPVVPGTWYDVITTWDGSTLREYVNGVQVATMPAVGALGLPTPDTAWHWTLGANAAPPPAGFSAPARVSIATSKVWSTALPGGPSVPITVPTSPDTSAKTPDIINVDFADGTPAEHAQNLPVTTYGAPTIATDDGLGANVATFNGTTDAYTYPFQDQWSKVANSFTIECKFRWNGAAPSTSGKGVCEDLNGGGIGVDVLNGEAMTYAHIGGACKEIFDPTPVVPGTWYDVITTWDGVALTEYVNGVQVATMPATGALGLPSPSTAWHWTLGANAAATPAGIEAPARVSIATSKVWSDALPSAGTAPVYQVGQETGTINVGLQPAAMTVHNGAVFVANTNNDTVSIIDAATHNVMQTVNVEPLHGATVGASPNSITFADDKHMLVSLGGDNAVAVFNYTNETTPVGYKGLIPTDWYPNQVSFDARLGKVIVSNQQGIGTNGYPQSHKYQGTLTSFTLPADADLDTTTQTVFNDNAWNTPKATGSGTLPGGQAPAIPNQLGQPSAIKHVFLIIKENRTYDQILGDLGKGNGDPADTTYGATVTPNEHSLANTFTDFDNFYDSGMLSADGHQWLVQGDNNDYQAQNAASTWARSYPYPGGDALSYQRDGFIWNTVENAGGTVRNYGEFEAATTGKQGTWQQYYADSQIMEGKATGPLPIAQNSAQWVSDVPSLNQISNHDYPHFAPAIPDQYRADIWEQDFQQAEQTGVLPSLTTMTLGDDHTGGAPTGAAQNADNDLAVGRIISDISHSQFWKDSAVFVVEDDTQAGSDHVDGHRGPLWIASPYAKRGVVNSEYYTQVNVVKTIEQILGAQPMNQMDQAAIPMWDAFTNTPDDTPYETLPNQVPLTQGVSNLIPLTPSASTAANPAAAAAVTATNGPAAPPVPAAEQSVAAAWTSWYTTEAEPKLSGPNAAPDATNPAQMNRYDWYTSTNWSKPYPGDKQILAPDQVPGRNLPSGLLGD